MRHFFTTKVRVVLIVALLLTAGLAVLTSLTGTTIGDLFVKTVLTPLRSGAQSLTAQAEQLYNYIFEYESLAVENEKLKQELAALQESNLQAAAKERENERLRALLELKAMHEDYQLVDAYIIGRSSVEWSHPFTINRGTTAGIEPGMCAITEKGEVIGLVVEAGSNYAVIKSVLDPSLEISATIASSGYSGMVQGAYSAEHDGLLLMDYLPSSSVIRNNDRIVTSGSTVYPRNLILGYVVDAGFNDTGVAKFALLRPAADLDALEQVFIITSFRTE
jgi:rod shape-determining protein MreC